MLEIQTEKFEGPLDLLLQLIEKEKLNICEISLAKITDGYLEKVSSLELSESEMAEFLVIASKLLYIKSKQLLPQSGTEEEEDEIADLEAKLMEYQKYKEAAKKLEEILNENQRSYVRKVKNEIPITFLPPQNLDSSKLYAIFEEIIKEAPEEIEEKIEEPVKVTLEEKRESIRTLIKKNKKVSFKGILKGSESKIDVIVTFLAILEMIKQQEIIVTQDKNFADFTIVGVK